MLRLLRAALGAGLLSVVLLAVPGTGTGGPGVVGATDAGYLLCGRVFADPHAYWPSSEQAPGRSPFAKGNAECAATDFVYYDEMITGMEYLEGLFPDFIEFYELERDFGDGSECTSSTSNADLCSAGLPRQGVPAERIKSDLYMIRVTDERVPDTDKKFFVFPLAIHGIERAGAEAGVRAAEDLATWAACEAGLAPEQVNCAQEGAIPHPLLEAQPDGSVTAGDALRGSAVYFVFANPDGWRRGDPDNLFRFYQRYNGNGVDLNRDWPTIGFTFRPYTPWSEPETRGFGQVLKGIREQWDGGIDLHGQLIDRAFSFTLLGASQRDYAKDQRILQTVKGAWADAEARLAWSPVIKPNDAPEDDPRLYGVQWGTVWDTIDYTVTGSLGDWIDSPLGLGGDGIDNEMSLSHLSNCGTGTCYLADFEQLHVDGNKSLIYAMINFTLLPEDTAFRAPGKVGYVFDPRRISHPGDPAPTPAQGEVQDPILDVSLDATNGFTHAFLIKGPDDAPGFANGGVEGVATPTAQLQGTSTSSLISLVLERWRGGEPVPIDDPTACADDTDNWEEVNRYYNQSPVYLQSGQAVHANNPSPGPWRICLTGGVVTQNQTVSWDLDITFSAEKAWEDPGQLPYDVSNMDFFADLAQYMEPGQLEAVNVDDVLSGAVDLGGFTSVVVADAALPGYTEPISEGPAQEGFAEEPPAEAALTAPCAGDADAPPTCRADYEFDVDPAFNNQQLIVTLDSPDLVENDWDLYVQRQSVINGEWFTVGQSTSPTGDERVTLLMPPGGHYRARIVNWLGTAPPSKLEVAFSNVYAGPPLPESTRTDAERDAWGAKLREFVAAGGNLVLTDGAVKDLAYMGLVPREKINTFAVFAGFVGFTRDGTTSTYDDPLAQNVNQPGAAEGPQFRHQTYEPVPIGFDIGEAPAAPNNTSPVWAVDQATWEELGGRTAGITTADQVTLGELRHGDGVVRVIGALMPMPTDQFYHPFGLSSYALTYTGYQLIKNALQRPLPDLTLEPADIAFSDDRNRATITATIHNAGEAPAAGVRVRFEADGAQIGELQTIDGIAAGGSGTASVVWDIRGKNGEHTVTVTADPGDAIAESDEANNSASRTVLVRGNQVQNGSFESSSNGSSPDSWSSSGGTTYAEDGSDGERSVTADATGSWVSDPIDVVAGTTYGTSVDVAGAAGTLLVEQLSETGALLATSTQALSTVLDMFETVTGSLTTVEGAAQVRLTLLGGVGTTTFDDVKLWQE